MPVQHGNGKGLLHSRICMVAEQQDEQQVDA